MSTILNLSIVEALKVLAEETDTDVRLITEALTGVCWDEEEGAAYELGYKDTREAPAMPYNTLLHTEIL